uniref:Periodic tryptophan protein 1 n=1 Tax=Timema poppense TaxID=170557 RepID=A0A7R9CM17_TIMPO|nr:unnamed protein product [Timema poppensis]
MEGIISSAKEDLQDAEDGLDDLQSTNDTTENKVECEFKAKQEMTINNDQTDEYNFDNYDEDNDNPNSIFGIGNMTVFASNHKDPYVTIADSEDEDSEEEDDVIKPDDNLIVVGHVDGDASILEVYVFNEEEGSLYVHHDVMLPSIPLCLEWLSKDLGSKTESNLVAVGSMDPIIGIWDLDLVNCLEPVFELGQKRVKNKKTKCIGHRDAVLDIAWNESLTHMLASGSVDQTVILWDLDTGKMTSSFTQFQEKVQTLQWHPKEMCALLTGSCDGYARLIECRSQQVKEWKVSGEVERVVWDHHSAYCFLVGTSNGYIEYLDARSNKPIWSTPAHEKEVTGLVLSSKCPGLLISTGSEGVIKIWDIDTSGPVFISEKKLKLGALQCLDANPDLPFIVCTGGDCKSSNFHVMNLAKEDPAVRERFAARQMIEQPSVRTSTEDKSEEVMEIADDTTNAFQSLSLEHASLETSHLKTKAKKKNYKNK